MKSKKYQLKSKKKVEGTVNSSTLANKLKISVVIPVFNRENFIKRTLDSVMNQTLKPAECIVYDDASTDETVNMIESYLEKFRALNIALKVIKGSTNKGVSHARNQGVAQSSSEWIAFLDSDDEWLNNKLEIQAEHLTENSADIIHSNETWIRNGQKLKQLKKHEKSGGDIFIKSLEHCTVSPSAVLIKKEYLNKLGGFDENLKVCEDYDLWLRVSVNESFAFISKPLLLKHGGHSDQLSFKYHSMDIFRIKSMLNILEVYRDKLSLEKLEALKRTVLSKFKKLESSYLKRGKIIELKELSKLINNKCK